MKRHINGVLVDMTPDEVAAFEAEQATYVPPPSPEIDPETILREAMFEDFVERSAKNASTPKAIKEAALAYKARQTSTP